MLTGFLRRYPVPLCYLAGLCLMSVIWDFFLSGSSQGQLVGWASTNVANLPHRPVSTLTLSAFITEDGVLPWLVLASVSLFLLVRRFGNLRAAVLVISGHVVGTVVSEGMAAMRIHQGTLPGSDRYISDVGPSYIVAAALVGVIVAGPELWKRGVALAFWLLACTTWFAGLGDLDVPAIGHSVAMITGAALAGLFMLGERRYRSSGGSSSSRSSNSPSLTPSTNASHSASVK